jgi:hypothetical protein
MEKTVAAKKPFFLQVSHYANHLKFKSSPAMLRKFEGLPKGKRHKDTIFAGMNGDLDAGVGQIMEAVDTLGISDNTYIVYTADNGFDQSNDNLHGEAQRKAWPLSYSKGFVFEGGVRVPFIVRGPGIKSNTFSSVPVVGYDLMPTFLELIKPGFPVPQVTEGGSLVRVLKNGGVGRVERPKDFIVFHYPNGVWPSQTALIKDNYKIVKTWAFDRIELFDLQADMSEQKDLSKQMPEKAEELHAVMTSYLKSVDAVAPAEDELANDRTGLLMKKGGAEKKDDPKKKPSQHDNPNAIPFSYDDYDITWDNELQRPKGMVTWDYWFAVDEEKEEYHAFYLQFPKSMADDKEKRELRHKHQAVGHAISKDLKTWRTVKDALRPIPGTFNDIGIATASVVKRVEDGKWIMLFTSKGSNGGGMAPAISDDLINWEKMPQHLFPFSRKFKAEWQGKMYEGQILADPYVHPEKMNGYYWMSINSRMLRDDYPEDKKGGIAMFKSVSVR